MVESFFSICPRSKEYIGYNITGIPLKVIQSKGIEYSPHIKFSEAELEKGAKYFHNNSGKADKFSITVVINSKDTVNLTQGNSTDVPIGKHENVIDVLDYFIRKEEPFYVTTRAVGISNKELWLITENSNRKQNFDDGYVEWDLTFTKKIDYTYAVFKNTNTGVTKALKKYKKKKQNAKEKTTAKNKLKKCKLSKLKYSSKKKVVPCVKTLQTVLNKNGCLDKKYINGWYHTKTKTAVKQFQKKYAKKYKLKKNGKVDKATFKALCKV